MEFFSPDCAHCQRLEPVLEAAADELVVKAAAGDGAAAPAAAEAGYSFFLFLVLKFKAYRMNQK